MTIVFHRNFEKRILRLRAGERQRLRERLEIFLREPFAAILNNHPLKGKYVDCRSINTGGDLRTIYKMIGDDECVFFEIGPHGELYS